MSTPQGSILVTAFNRADLLPKAVDSALAQTVSCEIVIVDHGSSDATPEVARSYGDKVRYVRKDQDFGPHFSWLDGVLHTHTPYIHIQHDDDWIEPEFMEKCLALMAPDVGFAFSQAHVMDGEILRQELFLNWARETGAYGAGRVRRRVERTLISPSACLFRRDVLIDAIYQGRLPLQKHDYHGVGPDVFMSLLSLLRYPKVGYVAEPLAKFLAHEGSITIDALADKERWSALNRAYGETRKFYRYLQLIKLLNRLGF